MPRRLPSTNGSDGDRSRCRLPPHDPDELAALLYTSGLDRAAQGGDAEPRQSVARRDQRRALSAAPAATTAPSRVLPLSFDYGQNQLLSTWAAGGCAIAARLSARRAT